MECGLLFLCIYIIKLKERWFTKIAVKVSDDVRNLYLFPSVWDTCSCWGKMQSGIFCITVISGMSVTLIFTQAGREFFTVSVLCVLMAFILMPEQSRADCL